MSAKLPVPGWVYVMESESFPGFVKIGCTTRTPSERAAELSRSSGVPLPLLVVASRPVTDCQPVERAAHRMLADVRVSKDREFFRCSAARAIEVINAVADAYPVQRQIKPLRPFPARPVAMLAPPLSKPYPVNVKAWKRYRRRRSWRLSPGGLRVLLVSICAAVSIVAALLKPDLSAIPPGHLRSTLLLLEGWRR